MEAHKLPAPDKAPLTHETLDTIYKHLAPDSLRTPKLISTMLSHRTNHAGTHYHAECFSDWDGVMKAMVDKLADAIKTTCCPSQKAPRVQETFRLIKREQGEINIGFLGGLPVEDALNWLARLPGVGPKTPTLLLLLPGCAGEGD